MANAQAKAAMSLHQRTGISLKAAWARVKGGRGGAGTPRRSNPGSSGSNTSREPRMGAVYQRTKTAAQIASIVTDPVLKATLQGRGGDFLKSDLMSRFDIKNNPQGLGRYARGVVVTIADAWGSKKIRHAAALSRKSASGLAPEVYATVSAMLDQDLDPVGTHADFIQTTNGYDPGSTDFSTKGKLRTYLGLKYGGFVVRKIVTAVPAVGEPIREGLRLFGMVP